MLATFRESLMSQFETALSTVAAIEFKAGMLSDNPAPNRAIGCVWIDTIREVGSHVLEENIIVGVRVFQRFIEPPTAENPADPTVLEAFAEALQVSVGAAQTGEGPWFQRVQSIKFDLKNQGFEAQILAWNTNPSTQPIDATVKFAVKDGVNSFETARADGSLIRVEKGKPYTTTDKAEIAVLSEHPALVKED